MLYEVITDTQSLCRRLDQQARIDWRLKQRQFAEHALDVQAMPYLVQTVRYRIPITEEVGVVGHTEIQGVITSYSIHYTKLYDLVIIAALILIGRLQLLQANIQLLSRQQSIAPGIEITGLDEIGIA